MGGLKVKADNTTAMIKIIPLCLILIFSVSCMANTAYYKSEDESVLASARKGLLSPKKNSKFSSIIIDLSSVPESNQLSKLYIQVNSSGLLSLDDLSLSSDLIKSRKDFHIPSHPYIPNHLSDTVILVYGIRGINVIINPDSHKVLRISISHELGDSIKIGVTPDALFELPLSVGELERLFGKGKVYSVFNL